MSGIRYYPQMDLSGGVQSASSFLMRRQNELGSVRNATFSDILGGVVRRNGSQQVGSAFGDGGQNTPTGGYIAKFTTGNKRFVAVNNSGNTATIIRVQDPGTGNWTTLTDITGYPTNARVFFFLWLDEVYVTGFDSTGEPLQVFNVDNTLSVSATRNILNAPYPYYIQEYAGALYAGNVRFLVSQIPKMSGPALPAGVASASSEFNTNLQAFRAFDGSHDKDYKWVAAAATTTGWLKYDFGSGNTKIIRRYSMVAIPINEFYVDSRAPKTWTFEGSNDNTNWTVLDTQTNVAVWTRGERRTYDFANTTAYRYYRINVSAAQTGADVLAITELEMFAYQRYPDRAYKSSGPLGAITFVQSLQTFNVFLTSIVNTWSLKVDSVRYLKPGMSIDIYKGGTDKKLYDLVITDVDKVNNTILVPTYSLNFATGDVNTGTEEITLSDTTLFQTGTPIVFNSSTTIPAGLTVGTVYYAIWISSTKIKVATTEANARAGTAVNITSTGAGTHSIGLVYTVSDNDEVWLDGRKGKLTTFWNTDFPFPEKADWTATRPGIDSSNAIMAMRKSSNRLFLFTKNSGQKFDGGNVVPFNTAVGCISQNSLLNIDDDWLVWIDQVGRVWARNDSSNQQEYISRGLYKLILRFLTQAQLQVTSAVVNNNNYKLYLGTVNVGYGNENLRIVYSFDDNVWSIESLGKKALFQENDDSSGAVRPYLYSDDGKIYIDETGNMDGADTNGANGTVIPFKLGLGRTHLNTQKVKKFVGVYIYSQDCAGALVKVAVAGGQPIPVGQIEYREQYIEFPEQGENVLPRGRTAELFIDDASRGKPQAIEGLIWAYTVEEENPRAEQ